MFEVTRRPVRIDLERLLIAEDGVFPVAVLDDGGIDALIHDR